MIPRLLATVSCALLVAACAATQTVESPIVDPVPNGIVAGTIVVRVENGVIILRNTTEFVVTYRLIEAETATRALFPVCTITSCPRLAQGEERRIPYAEITGWSPAAREAILPWWRMIPQRDGSLTPDARSEGVRIQL
jgi:hypothetical protein